MKKVLFIILSFILFLSLFSCNNNEINIEPDTFSEDITISYLGPKGTYTEEASELFFNNKGTYKPYENVKLAVEALINNEANYSVIPQENTIGGAVIDYIDIVIEKEELSVVGEIELPITQNLLVYNGAKLSDIKKVYSHKQGILQGADYIKENLKDVEVVEVSSTAEGARLVSEAKDKSVAAIASLSAAKLYNLDILAKSIQKNDNNKTRFYVLSKDKPRETNKDRIAFIAKGNVKELPNLLKRINEENVNLITIHDRPLKTVLGEYYYLIECSNITYEKYEKIINNINFNFRYLGSFNVV